MERKIPNSKGNIRSTGAERGAQPRSSRISETCKIGPMLVWRPNRKSRILRFRLVPKAS